MTIAKILESRLCIGCGFCSGVCPESCITMTWSKSSTWLPVIDVSKCNDCGLCLDVCPNSINSLKNVGSKSIITGGSYGLNDKQENIYYISYATTNDTRLPSASGGTATSLLCYLLASGKVNFVVAAKPRMGKIGEPHFETVICRSLDDIKACCSSAYGPLRYDLIIREIAKQKQPCAMTALPCLQRAIENLPEKYRKYIRFTVGITCSHNVTDQFGDYMAYRHGIHKNEYFTINYRDKEGIPDANHFNTCFKFMDGRKIRSPRMKNGFTPAWRNYWFAQECCLYCPDFYNAYADISIKDAWGPLSYDQLGISLCIVRNEEIKEALLELKSRDHITLEECNSDVIRNSQNDTAVYKQVNFICRWLQHPSLQETAKILFDQLYEDQSIIKDYLKKLRAIRVSKILFHRSKFHFYLSLILIVRIINLFSIIHKKINNIIFSK
jgi:coenzyme F420-reducing hydrogenase beta subunit